MLARARARARAFAIAREAIRAIRLARVKLTAVAGTLLVVLLLTATSLVALARRHAAAPSPPPPTEPVYAIDIDRRTSVRVLGVSPFPPDARSWFAADGTRVALPDGRLLDATAPTAVPPQFVLAVRVANPTSDLMRLGVARSVAGANVMLHDGDGIILVCLFSFMDAPDRATIELGLADDAWKTIGSSDRPHETSLQDVPGFGQVRFEPVRPNDDDDGGSTIVIRHRRVRDPYHLVAIDEARRTHAPRSVNVSMFPPPDVTTTCAFDVPPEEVKRVELQAKPFTRFVDVRDVALRAGRPTRPTMTVR